MMPRDGLICCRLCQLARARQLQQPGEGGPQPPLPVIFL